MLESSWIRLHSFPSTILDSTVEVFGKISTMANDSTIDSQSLPNVGRDDGRWAALRFRESQSGAGKNCFIQIADMLRINEDGRCEVALADKWREQFTRSVVGRLEFCLIEPIDNERAVWLLLLHRSLEIRPILFYDKLRFGHNHQCELAAQQAEVIADWMSVVVVPS
jgi:hypothetical protein